MPVINVAIALTPVVAFLAMLCLMDSFRLVRPAAVLAALAYGVVAAAAILWLHDWLIQVRHVPAGTLSRYVAPLTEETAKALLVVVLVATARVGFLVDAAVLGFAVGTGFALFENLSYLQTLRDATLTLWLVRGLGTAMLQGATTAIFAMLSKTYADQRRDRLALAFVPGWAAAVVIHSTFNHRLLPAVAQTLVLLVTLPLLMLWIFSRSERKLSPAATALSQLMNMKPRRCGAAISGNHSGMSLHAATFSCSRKSSVVHVNEASLLLVNLHSVSTSCMVILFGEPFAL